MLKCPCNVAATLRHVTLSVTAVSKLLLHLFKLLKRRQLLLCSEAPKSVERSIVCTNIISCCLGHRAGDEPAIVPRVIGRMADAAEVVADAVFGLQAADGVEGAGCFLQGLVRAVSVAEPRTATEPIAVMHRRHYIYPMSGNEQSKTYSYPPIIEVVAEVRLVEPVNANRQKKAKDWISRRYEIVNQERQVEANIDFAGRTATFKDSPLTFRLNSADFTNRCTLAPHAVAWVRNAPYEGWEAFQARIAEELPLALDAYGMPVVARVGLRYVNRIDVEPNNGIVHYEDFLNFRISHGEILEPTSAFQWQVTKVFPDLGLSAIVQSAVVEPELPDCASFSFDIDVFYEPKASQQAREILERLEDMRRLKNAIFEAGITDRARENYK